jgi:uncharacterized protein YfaS (alpha-2-macroglobulin family)
MAPLAGSAWAIDYLNVTVQPDRAVPAACLSFTTELPRGKAQALEPFIAIVPALDHSLDARGKDLCIGGLQHGQTYRVKIKAGLPGSDGTSLSKDVPVDIQIPDREQNVFFDQGKTLLPFTKGVGLPVKSVNVSKAHITLYRFSDRTMVDHLVNDWFGQAVSFYNLENIADRSTKLFEGSLSIDNVRNKQVSTTIPIDQLIKKLEPGVYVVIATTDTDKLDRDKEQATQWFSISDIGLTTVKTDAGMLVSAHSLQSGEPMAGIDLRLIARSNEMLGTWKTDAGGRFMIPGGLLRGDHGDAPKIIAALDGTGGFSWIQLDQPALDLSDLDIKGRTPPAANDAFLWTDRGIYRPGETIHLGAMLRDRNARPVIGVPLTLHIVRPDGIEVEKRPIPLESAGAGTVDVKMADNAFSGTWNFWASAGDKEHIGDTSVSVQDFVPPRLEAKANLPAGPIAADSDIEVDVAADYFYGSPGAGLAGTIDGTLQAAATPFKDLDGFSFGLVQEPFLPKALDTQSFTTDDKGKAVTSLKADDLPDTTSPLEIVVHATVNDVDGRAAVAQTSKVLHTADRFIGLKPDFTDLPDGAIAKFEVALVDGDGKPLSGEGLKWELVKEDYTYNYYFRDGRWQSNETIIDSRVNGGDLVLGPSGRGTISAAVTNGRWRLEAYDASGKTATSLRFEAGWWATSEAENRKPEVMPVTIDAHPPTGRVRAMIEPSFAGRVLVMLDGNGLHGIQDIAVAKGGSAVEFDASDVPAAGAYVLAVAISPAGAVVPRLPVRAIGLAWVPGAAAAHKLDVALKAPDTIHPKTTLAVDIDVSGAAAGEETYVTLAAVDEAVLRMTDFATPDAADHYLGRREPGVELRDVYSSLIDPAGQAGQLAQGGDGNANAKAVGLDVKTFKTVALFKGPVRLDAQGHATVSVEVPDFSGRLRLMAMAWTGERYGKAERPVTVRPPLLAELTLPRFLAPGDKVRARLMLTDLEAAEQPYTVDITTKGAVKIDRNDALFEDVKRDKRRYVDRTLIATAIPGVGAIHMVVTGADGTKTERDFEISVRTPNAFITQRQIVTLAPGQKLAIDDTLGEGLVPGNAKLDITASTLPAFDVTGLLTSLRRYPYGCTEQTISRAFPELFAKRLGVKLPTSVADNVTGQGAIQRLYSLQASDGSFGYWTSFDTGNFWLTAYAVDFMQHARAEGLQVPEQMESRAVSWLAGRFGTVDNSPQEVAGAAYAAIVLSRADRLDLSQLRYVATRVGDHLPSDIARIQLAAALTHVGERDMAKGLIEAASITRDPNIYLNDYGTHLRDKAMMLSLFAEEKLLPQEKLVAWATDLARGASADNWLSTQEEAWLLRAAFDLHSTTPLQVVLNGTANKPGAGSIHASMPLNQGKTSKLVNTGQSPIYVSLAATGIPAGVQPADAAGFNVTRDYFHMDGTPADLADVHQNDELVIVVSGAMDEKFERKILAVDMLPAGLEPETVGLATDHDDGQFKWLKGLTEPTFFSLRDDRYIAGIDLTEGAPKFKFAYVVRAVSPGTFVNPGPQVEDMYAPAFHARGSAGTLEVKAARLPAPAQADTGKVHLKAP